MISYNWNAEHVSVAFQISSNRFYLLVVAMHIISGPDPMVNAVLTLSDYVIDPIFIESLDQFYMYWKINNAHFLVFQPSSDFFKVKFPRPQQMFA